MLILSSQYYSPGSGLVPAPLKFAGEGCGIFVCLLAGFRLDPSSQRLGVVLLFLESLFPCRDRDFHWVDLPGKAEQVDKQSMFYSCSRHLGLTPT